MKQRYPFSPVQEYKLIRCKEQSDRGNIYIKDAHISMVADWGNLEELLRKVR